MSLDIFGGIANDIRNVQSWRNSVTELCAQLGITVLYDSLDEEDFSDIAEEVKNFGQLRLAYTIYASEADHDATPLWIEARDAAMEVFQKSGVNPSTFKLEDVLQLRRPDNYRKEILKSRLGGFVNALRLLSQDAVVAVALVDGGIHRVKRDSAINCVNEILDSFILPWDCSPNTLYVFGKPSS